MTRLTLQDFTAAERAVLGDYFSTTDETCFDQELEEKAKANAERVVPWNQLTLSAVVAALKKFGGQIKNQTMLPVANLLKNLAEPADIHPMDDAQRTERRKKYAGMNLEQVKLSSSLTTESGFCRNQVLRSLLNYLYADKGYPLPKKILIVGAGLEYASMNRYTQHADEPPYVYEPFSLLDILGDLGEKPQDVKIDVIDINPAVVSYISDINKEARKGTGFPVAMEISGNDPFDNMACVDDFMHNIATDRSSETDLTYYAKATLIPEAAAHIEARQTDVITEKAGAKNEYDLIIMQQVLLYFSTEERLLATFNLGHSLKAGGFIVHSEALPTDVEPFSTPDRLQMEAFMTFDGGYTHYPYFIHTKSDLPVETDALWMVPGTRGFRPANIPRERLERLMVINTRAFATAER